MKKTQAFKACRENKEMNEKRLCVNCLHVSDSQTLILGYGPDYHCQRPIGMSPVTGKMAHLYRSVYLERSGLPIRRCGFPGRFWEAK